MKNLFKTKKGGKQVRFVLFSLICLGGLGSCMDKNVEVNLPSYVASDPNVEVVFTDSLRRCCAHEHVYQW